MDSQLEELLKYCRENNRVCPQPMIWDRIWRMLPNRKEVGSGWNPPLPLILAAWWEASDQEKIQRFEQHIRWAFQHGVISEVEKAIRGLSEDQWYHSGD